MISSLLSPATVDEMQCQFSEFLMEEADKALKRNTKYGATFTEVKTAVNLK